VSVDDDSLGLLVLLSADDVSLAVLVLLSADDVSLVLLLLSVAVLSEVELTDVKLAAFTSSE